MQALQRFALSPKGRLEVMMVLLFVEKIKYAR